MQRNSQRKARDRLSRSPARRGSDQSERNSGVEWTETAPKNQQRPPTATASAQHRNAKTSHGKPHGSVGIHRDQHGGAAGPRAHLCRRLPPIGPADRRLPRRAPPPPAGPVEIPHPGRIIPRLLRLASPSLGLSPFFISLFPSPSPLSLSPRPPLPLSSAGGFSSFFSFCFESRWVFLLVVQACVERVGLNPFKANPFLNRGRCGATGCSRLNPAGRGRASRARAACRGAGPSMRVTGALPTPWDPNRAVDPQVPRDRKGSSDSCDPVVYWVLDLFFTK